MPSPILVTHDLHKFYGDVHAVQGVSFSINSGEIYSLLGPNGAGKATTIGMLTGLLTPTRGDAIIGGYSITKDPQRVKEIIGVVPQEIALYDDLTARENLDFWGRMVGLRGQTLKTRIEEMLELAGLTDRAKDKVETFSGGMKRRLNIAVGLLHHPKILFMDEPTVGIDPQSRRRILDTVKALNRAGLTVLYTTHYMEEAQELSHRIGIIDHGRLIAEGTLDELIRMVGTHETLRFTLESPPADVTAFLTSLQDLPEVQAAAVEDGILVLQVVDANRALPRVLPRLASAGGRVRAIEIQEPNLEAVFLHLTGRALRD